MNSDTISQFPITPFLNEICDELKNSSSRFLVLTAETGAGKSTILPIGLLKNFKGKILMTEPRRLAVLGVANRVSDLLEEECGKTAGYKIHLENKTTSATRLEVVTEAILVRYLQKDPALEDYSVVVIDEFHERSVYTDLNLAFLKEAMELRDDLFVVIMSATINTQKLVEYLSSDKSTVPVKQIPGRCFPVEINYKENYSVENAIMRELESKHTGFGNTILAFLPGIKEIRKCKESLHEKLALEEQNGEVEILILHSSVSLSEQKYIISGGNKTATRIIISSAIAETSLTVPGVYCVIDSGLARVNRMNVSTGMENLVTESESLFSAEQRAGRAGREGPGKCIRLWSEFEPRIKEVAPEILRTDLAGFVLECAERGIYSSKTIALLDSPTENAWNSSLSLLKNLKLVREDGRITPKGKAVLALGMEIRLAAIALEGKILGFEEEAVKIALKYSSYAGSSKEVENKFLQNLKNRLSKIDAAKIDKSEIVSKSKQLLIIAGFADRIAKRISLVGDEKSEYQFPSGRKAILVDEKNLNPPEWIVAPEVLAGNSEGIIFTYESLPLEEINQWLLNNSQNIVECSFEYGKVQKLEKNCFGEIVLSSKRLPAEKEDLAQAWIHEVHKKGIKALPMDEKTKAFLERAAFFAQQTDFEKYNQLEQQVEEWLLPFMSSGNQLNSKIVYDALYWYLEGSVLDKEVPEAIILENGRKCKIKYELQSSPEDKNKLVMRPVIEIIIQRIFGCKKTPEIAGMKVLLKLLSPASRPLQITDDLEGFWTGAWVEICKEMKGRYPKHCWDPNIICKD